MKNHMIKDALILFVITLIAGLALGAVNYITKEPIARAKEKAKNEAYVKVLPEAVSFTDSYGDEVKDSASLLHASGNLENVTIDACVTGLDAAGNVAGYIVSATCSESYGGEIGIAVGFKADLSISSIEVLTINDTPGLGMKAKEEGFRGQYTGALSYPYSITTSGKSAAGEIDAISSATITSKAFNKAVNASALFIRNALNTEGGNADE